MNKKAIPKKGSSGMALFYILFNERLYYFVFTNITFFGIKGDSDLE